MIVLDTNILVCAYRSDAPGHVKQKQWVECLINGSEAYGVVPQVLVAVVRICTHPRIFVRPSSLPQVFNFCRHLIESPNAVLINPGKKHWATFESVCQAFNTKGNDVQLAWFAALAMESGGEWTTTDARYARF